MELRQTLPLLAPSLTFSSPRRVMGWKKGLAWLDDPRTHKRSLA
jgi:hypothetical protein